MRTALLLLLTVATSGLCAQSNSGIINGQITGTIPGTPLATTPAPAPTIPQSTPAPTGYRLVPLHNAAPTLSPAVLLLLEQESKFQQAVIEGGGKAFSTFFADDAVILSNGKPAVLGRGAIAAQAQWDPKTYQLTWITEGAQMGPSGDMGFTWGHYEGRMSNPADLAAKPTTTSGRYITLWKKLGDGTWKVSMDASADEPPPAAADPACCTVPHP